MTTRLFRCQRARDHVAQLSSQFSAGVFVMKAILLLAQRASERFIKSQISGV